MTRRSLSVFLLASALLLAACGDDSKTTTTTTTSSSTTSTTLTPTSAVAAGSTSEVSVPDSKEQTHLTAIRAAAQGGGDRVTFEFDGTTPPGYQIKYADAPLTRGESNEPLAVAGDSVLRVRFSQASGLNLTGGGEPTYKGPARFTPADTHTVAEVVQQSDFEAVLIWAIGTHGKAPFTVSTLTAPARVVIDFTH